MRTARPTAALDRMRRFYELLVGLPVLWSFDDHDGFDGIVFGVPDERAQLELVNAPHDIVPQPTIEDALVLFCEPTTAITIAERLREADVEEVPEDAADLNPFWPRNRASTFLDPDGYRLIIAIS